MKKKIGIFSLFLVLALVLTLLPGLQTEAKAAAAGSITVNGYTLNSGYYLPTGIYGLEIIKNDFEYVYSEIEITESSDAWNFLLSVIRGDITGTVNCDVYANSQANLELHMDGKLAGTTGVSPNGGNFGLAGFPVGSYLLTVTLPGYKTVELPVNLKDFQQVLRHINKTKPLF